MDQYSIALTHVCRSWRNTFTSRSSLWTWLNFKNIDKTRTYIQRSQSSPLKLHLEHGGLIDDTFPLVIPHISRLGSLTIDAKGLPDLFIHFTRHAPLLEKLDITGYDGLSFTDQLFNRDLSSLWELRLEEVDTRFLWKNMANLRVFDLTSYSPSYGTTQILDFLESAPLLHTVSLRYSIPEKPDAPPQRMVLLRHLKVFHISAKLSPSTILHHLHIPIGASIISEFPFNSKSEPPFGDHLPGRSPNFGNLSYITTINLHFGSLSKCIRFHGPSGNLHVHGTLAAPYGSRTYVYDRQLLEPLVHPVLSAIHRLTISRYERSQSDPFGGCPIFRILSSTNDLRTLILIDCNNEPFILALDPEQNPSNTVLCSAMEALVVYVGRNGCYFDCLTSMAMNRASRGAKLPSITVVVRYDNDFGEGRLKSHLGKYVTHVEYRIGNINEYPPWDDIPGRSGGGVELVCKIDSRFN